MLNLMAMGPGRGTRIFTDYTSHSTNTAVSIHENFST